MIGHWKNSRPGWGELAWTLLLGVLLAVTAWLAFSVTGLQMLGSRTRVYCIASFVLLVFFFAARLIALFSGHRTAYVRLDFLIFVLPLLLFPFAGSPNGGASIAEAKSHTLANSAKQTIAPVPEKTVPASPVEPVLKALIEPIALKPKKEIKASVPASIANPPLVFNKDNFEDLYDEVTGSVEKYKGRKVVLDGFALPSDSNEAGRFSLGRLLITCCPADGIYMGFDAQTEAGMTVPPKDSWWRLEGEIVTAQVDGVTTAMLKVKKMTPQPLPEDPYIYQH